MISRSTRKQNSLEFWGWCWGWESPKKSTSLHPQSLDKLPELRWQQDTPVQHDQKTSRTCFDIMFLNCVPPSSWRSMQKTNLQKVTQVNHPGPSAVRPTRWVVWNPHTSRRRRSGGTLQWEPGEWTCMISRGWGVFLVLKIWRNRKLRVFFCSDT